jgi:hypothetical protein
MRRVLPLAAVLAVVVASPAPGASSATASGNTARAKFAGTWYGHTRSLRITRRGFARESIGDGCCNPVIDLKFRLSRARSSSSGLTARARVTAVHVRDKSSFSRKHPPPHVGEKRRIRLSHGVIHERITGTTYCDTAAGRRGVCGA